MSSFFTLPASEKKRKRLERDAAAPPRKKQRDDTEHNRSKNTRPRAPRQDDSISGSDSEAETPVPGLTADDGASESSEHENETAAEKRLRLAEQYLENLQQEVDTEGFDAADLDRDLIAERLKEDVSATKGKLYRFIASDWDFPRAVATQMRTHRAHTDVMTGIAACAPYIYTAAKDGTIIKWELPREPSELPRSGRPLPRRPTKINSSKDSHKKAGKPNHQHHNSAILSIAASEDGKFVVTGGADKKLIVWSAETLEPLRVFTQHRGSILGLAFRRGTNQLYSGSADRTIKTWSLNELAYVETLFGHGDHVADVAALAQERCISAGSRDRTVRLWKVVDEAQVVFRVGSTGSSKSKRQNPNSSEPVPGAEGSLDRVAYIDDDTFISGSDNGSISLWSTQKKKPIFTIPATHGFDDPPKLEEAFADIELEGKKVPSPPEARWITALVAVPYSDLILSGSWDGFVRVWRVSSDKKKIESVGAIGVEDNAMTIGGDEATTPKPHARGVINDLDVFERGNKGHEKLYVVAALGKEHRLGRWRTIPDGKNGAVIFKISMKQAMYVATDDEPLQNGNEEAE